MEKRVQGVGVSAGSAQGPAVVVVSGKAVAPVVEGGADPASEAVRLDSATERVAAEIENRAERAEGSAAEVLTTAVLMAKDPTLRTKARERVDSGLRAERAVWEAAEEFCAALEASGGYFAERVADVRDIRDRLISDLTGVPLPGVPELAAPSILVADDLAPADTATLDADLVLGFVTREGGPTSHTAILARSLGIPAVVACRDLDGVADGNCLILDGGSGQVTITDDSSVVMTNPRARPKHLDYAGTLSDGTPIGLLANLGEPSGVPTARDVRAPGVGLLRTEFLFDGRTSAPDAEQQRHVYEEVLKAFTGGRVVIRTLDAGSDKPLAFVREDTSPNPALGVRGLRVSVAQPELLDVQLQAIADAQERSEVEVWVMAPMVSTPTEAEWFSAKARERGIRKVGVMIEVPAAALQADRILEHVDFASIGTNDLAQYTFAADRMSGGLAELNDPWQPALLELIATVGEAGRRRGKPVGVCGEAAADPILAPVLVGLGATSLSMTPRALPAVGRALSRMTAPECGQLAKRALIAATPETARAAVSQEIASE
ncbi:phosphoenolpyruvate--protein phosphotransferase [Saccharopolyspora erythraea]|uniref:phosphoenolpyruvate--protein phosphotransferase n=1 Tax=Saccharopolyspora erythraea TaxID=1836 RepID=UPI001BAC3EC9|nr:phosphoenolpyruvate--protein phosphotransferase [Saccharopolyspora erythraea]QUH04132.1 phosphoenolpyruvate--protein phosphotransferase [Saccharopolyspora erythraea]